MGLALLTKTDYFTLRSLHSEMRTKTTTIQKGHDPYIAITALSEYCRQRGWRVVSEVVTIVMPTGRELQQFRQDVAQGKILVVPQENSR